MAKDSTLTAIVDSALGRRDRPLSGKAIVAHTSRLLDTFACALGGASSHPAAIARVLAAESTSSNGCSVLGLAACAAPETAIFANTVAVRYLDYNDHFPGCGHPSDMVPALLAAAELNAVDGARFLLGIDAAYETAIAICSRNRFRDSGHDQGAHVAAGVAVGIAVMLNLPAAAIANAVAIAVTSTMPMRVTRTGELSDWKGCATAAATRNGYLAARLSALGMSGPPAPFEGVEGLDWHAPPRAPLRFPAADVDGVGIVGRTNTKLYPTEGNSQAILKLFADVREGFPPAAIEHIAIETYHRAWHEIGGGQGDHAEKWDPQTRETADHSLPYLVAVMLADGRIDHTAAFSLQRVSDPNLRPLMDRISIEPAADLTALHPDVLKSRVVIAVRNGTTARYETTPPPGDWQNPMTAADVRSKYDSMAALISADTETEALCCAILELPGAANVHELTTAMRDIVVPEQHRRNLL